MVVKYSRLKRLLNNWEKAVSQAETLAVDRSLFTLRETLIVALQNVDQSIPIERNSKSWVRVLLGDLEDRIGSEDPISRLYAELQPDHFAQLASALASSPLRPRPLLEMIESVNIRPSTIELANRLTRLVVSSDSQLNSWDSSGPIAAVLYHLMDHYDKTSLKQLFASDLARHGTLAFLSRAQPSMSSSLTIRDELKRAFELIVVASNDDVLASFVRDTDSFLDVYPRVSWRSSCYEMLTTLTSTLIDGLPSAEMKETPVELSEWPDDWYAISSDLASITVTSLTAALLEQILSADRSARDERSNEQSSFSERETSLRTYLSSVADTIADHLANQEHFAHQDRQTYDRTKEALTRIVWEAAAAVTPEVLSSSLTSVGVPFREDIFYDLATFYEQHLRALSESDEIPDPVRRNAEHFALMCLGSSQLHNNLASYVVRLAEHLSTTYPDLLESAIDHLGSDLHQMQGSFLAKWRDYMAARAAAFPEILPYLPWSTLTFDQACEVFEGFTSRLDAPDEEWHVVLQVKNLDASGSPSYVGGIIFYDPESFDFGQRNAWGLKRESDTPIAMARTSVAATSAHTATHKAELRLSRVLDALSFGISVRAQAGGFNPSVPGRWFAGRTNGNGWFTSMSRTREELDLPQSTSDPIFPKLSEAYDQLLINADSDTRSLNNLQQSFVRSLSWYRKGRWEPDPYARFTYFWIALEHLFAAGSRDKRLLYEQLPRLHETWHDMLGMHIFFTIRQIRKFMIEDPGTINAVQKLGWLNERDWGLLFLLDTENIKKLMEALPADNQTVMDYLERWLDTLNEISASRYEIGTDVEELRANCRFRLHLLTDVRNVLFHEALEHHPKIDVYADVLTHMLEDVLKKMVEMTVSEEPTVTSMQELIDLYQQPWFNS